MLTVDQVLESFRYEHRVITFIASKLSPEQMDYRPSEGQRSMLDLLQYLAVASIATLEGFVSGNWEHYPRYKARGEAVTLETFAAAMSRQLEEVDARLRGLDPETLIEQEIAVPWGGTAKLGAAIVEGPLKFLVAYRMQLFLYAKGAGLYDLTTYECWGGQDTPPPKSA